MAFFSEAGILVGCSQRDKAKYIERYILLERTINRKMEDMIRLKTKAEKVTSTISDMPREGKNENRIELAICEIIDHEREINKLVDKLIFLKKQINCYILITGDRDKNLLAIINN